MDAEIHIDTIGSIKVWVIVSVILLGFILISKFFSKRFEISCLIIFQFLLFSSDYLHTNESLF